MSQALDSLGITSCTVYPARRGTLVLSELHSTCAKVRGGHRFQKLKQQRTCKGLNHGAWAGYSWPEPKNWYNRIFLNFNGNVSTLSKKIEPIDEKYQSARLNTNLNIQSKKLWFIGTHIDYSFRQNDFYEPREEGWFFKRGASVGLGSWFQSNDSKKYSYSTEVFTRTSINFYKSFALDVSFNHSMRFNNRFSLSQSISLQPRFNNTGFTYVAGSSDIILRKG